MSVLLPNIGVTQCRRAKALIEEYPERIVGSFWVMCGYGFDEENIPDWWIDNCLREDQAKGILDGFNSGWFQGEHSNPLYLGFCIIVVADSLNPCDFSYVIQHLRMLEFEGVELLKIMEKYRIPAHTEVTFPEYFLMQRYGSSSQAYKYFCQNINHWTISVWEDYCGYLLANHGQGLLVEYYKDLKLVKEDIKAQVSSSCKPFLHTEGETDVLYLQAALELLNERSILEKIEIKWGGSSAGKGKNKNSGESGLNRIKDVFISNPGYLYNIEFVLLLYDCDIQIDNEDHGKLKIRKIPQIQNRKVKKGIENLFPDCLFTPEFYRVREQEGDYGEKKTIAEFQKMKFCKWICEERRNPDDFNDFRKVVNIIKDCFEF